MKSKELKNYNLPDNRTYNDDIDAKPINLFFILMIVAIIIVMKKLYIYGISLFVFALLCLFILPNRRMVEFYDDHMIVYNRARKDECNILYYEDIKSWEYIQKLGLSPDEIIFTLSDDSIQKLEAFNKAKFERLFNLYLANKKVVHENRSNRLRNSK